MVQISGMKQRKVVTLEEAKRAYAKEGHNIQHITLVGAIKYEFIVKKTYNYVFQFSQSHFVVQVLVPSLPFFFSIRRQLEKKPRFCLDMPLLQFST